MSNAAAALDRIDPRLRPAAQAVADARCQRLGEIPHDLDALGASTFAAAVADARAVLAALDILPPQPRSAGPVNAADASALRMDVGARTIAIITTDAAGRGRAVIAAAAHESAVLDHAEGNALWEAIAAVLRTLPDDPPPARQEPRP